MDIQTVLALRAIRMMAEHDVICPEDDGEADALVDRVVFEATDARIHQVFHADALMAADLHDIHSPSQVVTADFIHARCSWY